LKASGFSSLTRQPFAVTLALLVACVIVVAIMQPFYFRPTGLANNLRAILPLMLLAVAQTIIVIGGGVDLSIGTLMTLCSVVMVQVFGPEPSAGSVIAGVALGVLAGAAGGLVNGLAVAYLRLQPIIATFATSFIWAGCAIWVLPQPGGIVPQALQDAVRWNPLLPFTVIVIALVIGAWVWFLGTRGARALFASGGNQNAAFASGVNVDLVRLSCYVAGGVIAGLAALVSIADTATGDPLSGAPLTLQSVTAVVVGGTHLSGGAGSIVGSIAGVWVLALLREIVANLNLNPQWQTLVNGLIVLAALAGPGTAYVISSLRRAR
jgi:ribose transport system permease protein